jgi:hypothetical protein
MPSEIIDRGNEMLPNVAQEVCPPLPRLLVSIHQENRTGQDSTKEKRRTNPTQKQHPHKRPLPPQSTGHEETTGLGILLALEPRIMFDGAALVTEHESRWSRHTEL